MKQRCPISLLETCNSCRRALQIHAHFILSGLHHDTLPLSRLLSFFALSPSGSLPHSCLIFSHVDHPNLFMYNTMIRAYSRSSFPELSMLLYKRMIDGGVALVSPNKFTFPFLANGCARMPSLDGGLQVHAHVVKFGVSSDVFVGNSLIHCYCVFGDLRLARRVFDGMCERDVVSFNAMIGGLARQCRPVEALELFREMRGLGDDLNPDGFTMVALLTACSVSKDSSMGKLVHLFIYKHLYMGDIVTTGVVKAALLDMYVKCGMVGAAGRVFQDMGDDRSSAAWSSMIMGHVRCGEMEIARRLFNDMPEKDVVSWTVMISVCAQIGRYSEALEIYREMEDAGIEPDAMTMSSVLSAIAQLGALEFGKQVHERIEKGCFGNNCFLHTAIVDMYAKSGNIENALEVFSAVPEDSKSVSLFNSIISGLAKHGLAEQALEAFGHMRLLGLRPDKITFVGILSACSHGSLAIDGKKLFNSMIEEFGLEPEIEHYCCMVDLLGRCGLLQEAYDFITKMPIRASSAIWGALLSACRIHENVEIGMLVGQKIFEVEPNQGGSYVQLSSMYAIARQWEEAQSLRGQMDAIGIHKPAGWSSIEVNGSLHQFLAGDLISCEGKEISLMLAEMSSRLKSVNHICDTTQVSYDIDDEEKEIVVSRHSERLAFAFALVHLSNGETIRIMKNLRVCRDCHASFKIFSKSFAREIVVRDRIRFHHFKDGFCSCGDFW